MLKFQKFEFYKNEDDTATATLIKNNDKSGKNPFRLVNFFYLREKKIIQFDLHYLIQIATINHFNQTEKTTFNIVPVRVDDSNFYFKTKRANLNKTEKYEHHVYASRLENDLVKEIIPSSIVKLIFSKAYIV